MSPKNLISMKTISSNISVADLCDDLDGKKIIVNRDYQRSDKVWPASAKSFLIETILLDFPVPKIAFFQKTDLKTKKTIREIVDGQQRSSAIRDFFKGKFKLSKTIEHDELKNKNFDELDEELQGRFLGYSLSVDLFTDATSEDIAEVFRRINSYNVPLNPEEQRHANFQGDFKWFVSRVSKRLHKKFVSAGIFNEKKIVRMEDNKLLTDICHALRYGITTTKREHLDKLYKDLDSNFREADQYAEAIEYAFAKLNDFPEILNGPLMKPNSVYALVLALIHVRDPFPKLAESFVHTSVVPTEISEDANEYLAELTDAINNEEEYDGFFKDFLEAFVGGGTNVAEKKKRRFQAFCETLLD